MSNTKTACSLSSSDVLYMNQINDISFTIDNCLVVLIEHHAKYLRGVKPRLW